MSEQSQSSSDKLDELIEAVYDLIESNRQIIEYLVSTDDEDDRPATSYLDGSNFG